MAIQIQEDCIGLSVNPTLINSATSLPLDLTTASEILFRFLPPDANASVIEVTGNIDGDPTLGVVIYTNTSEEFYDPGTWKYQVKITFTGGEVWFSTINKIKVVANL